MIKYIKISLSKEHSKQEEDILFLYFCIDKNMKTYTKGSFQFNQKRQYYPKVPHNVQVEIQLYRYLAYTRLSRRRVSFVVL